MRPVVSEASAASANGSPANAAVDSDRATTLRSQCRIVDDQSWKKRPAFCNDFHRAELRHQHRIARHWIGMRIVEDEMEPAAFVSLERALDDQVGAFEQVAQLDQIGRDAKMAVVFVNFAA